MHLIPDVKIPIEDIDTQKIYVPQLCMDVIWYQTKVSILLGGAGPGNPYSSRYNFPSMPPFLAWVNNWEPQLYVEVITYPCLNLQVQLPIEAFISNFTMTIDDVVYIGKVLEKEEAQQVYDEAKDQDQTAGMVRWTFFHWKNESCHGSKIFITRGIVYCHGANWSSLVALC